MPGSRPPFGPVVTAASPMRLTRKVMLALAVAVLGLLAAGSQSELVSCGRNALSNGQFDAAISSWGPPAGFGFASWSKQDFQGSPSSGALDLVNDSAIDAQNVSVAQCEPILGNSSYELSAEISPLNYCCSLTGVTTMGIQQTLHTGSIYVLLNFYSKPSCGGTPLSDFVRLDAQGAKRLAAAFEDLPVAGHRRERPLDAGSLQGGKGRHPRGALRRRFAFSFRRDSRERGQPLPAGRPLRRQGAVDDARRIDRARASAPADRGHRLLLVLRPEQRRDDREGAQRLSLQLALLGVRGRADRRRGGDVRDRYGNGGGSLLFESPGDRVRADPGRGGVPGVFLLGSRRRLRARGAAGESGGGDQAAGGLQAGGEALTLRSVGETRFASTRGALPSRRTGRPRRGSPEAERRSS